jgi:hypothetical protein
MGLPTPNIFAGEHNFHSRLEWISTSDMHKAVEVIVELCKVWEILHEIITIYLECQLIKRFFPNSP